MRMFLGVIRPGFDVEGGLNAIHGDGHCSYWTSTGACFPDNSNWEGMKSAHGQGDRIDMLLDLDQGSMTVWKNDIKLGVMLTEGRSGPLCWAVTLSQPGTSVRIASVPAPESPTVEELAAAKAWQASH